MADIIVDTNIFIELVSSYNTEIGDLCLDNNSIINRESKRILKMIVDDNGESGYVVVSLFCVIELINQFNIISENGMKFSKEKVLGILNQPPEWMIFENLDVNLAKSLIDVPKITANYEKMENADSIQIATAISRAPGVYFLTTDHKIKDLNIDELTVKIL